VRRDGGGKDRGDERIPVEQRRRPNQLGSVDARDAPSVARRQGISPMDSAHSPSSTPRKLESRRRACGDEHRSNRLRSSAMHAALENHTHADRGIDERSGNSYTSEESPSRACFCAIGGAALDAPWRTRSSGRTSDRRLRKLVNRSRPGSRRTRRARRRRRASRRAPGSPHATNACDPRAGRRR
jgi:hypothetical protein